MKFLLLLLLITSCATKLDRNKDTFIKVKLMHTNDHHGHYLQDSKGQIGMAARKTLIDSLRTENKFNLLLSGGDINTGTMESDLFDAKPDFLGMKELKYDAMAVGNHEFDNSFETIKKQREWAGFPFLSANILWKKDGKPVFNPVYIIKEFNGIKVGIFGLTTTETPSKAASVAAREWFNFEKITVAAKRVVKTLREKEKVQIVIAVTHVGHNGGMDSLGDINLAEEVDGIDIIVGGHSQEVINAVKVDDTLIVQAEDWGKYVGNLDMYISKEGKLFDYDYRLIPVNLKKKSEKGERVFIEKEIAQDTKMQRIFAPYKKKAEILGQKKVGTLDKTFNGDRKKIRSSQKALGQFVLAAMEEKVGGSDIAIVNSGAIRSSLPAGKVTRKSIHTVHPYGNAIVTVKFSAKELFDYMKTPAKKAIVDPKMIIGGYPQIRHAKIYLEKGELVAIEAADKSWKISKNKNGKITSNKKSFMMATLNFLAKGGDGYPSFDKHPTYVDSGFMLNSAMMEYVEKRKKIKRNDFKITTQDVVNIK